MNSKPVLVIGAGIAGLATAYQLEEAGCRVLLLERSDRAGGRIYTHRDRSPSGLYADLGAERFPDSHERVSSCVQQFGLSIREFDREETAVLYSIGGRVFESTPESLLGEVCLQTTDGKRLTGRQQVMQHCLRPLLETVNQIPVSEWAHVDELRTYDALSVTDYLLSRGLSRPDIDLLTVGVGEVHKGSILDFMRHHLKWAGAKQWYHIEGGAERLVDAFRDHLRHTPRFNAHVTHVEEVDGGVNVRFREASREFVESGQCAVFAIPYTALRRLSISPALPHAKMKAVTELYYTPAVKIFARMRAGFWTRHEKTPLSICTDHPLEARLTPPMHGDFQGSMVIYAKGKLARQLDRAGSAKQELLTRVMSEILPGFDSLVGDLHFHHWSRVSGIWGAYSFYRPGQFFALDPVVAQKQGRLHFSGDHTSELPGWVEGALQSSHRVTSELCG